MWPALRRMRAFFRRDLLDDELAEEIRTHIELRRRALIAQGVSPADAEAEARRAFGNVANVRERMHDGWGFPSLDSLLQDLRYGARLLRRSPAFTAVAVLSLSLGIGAAAAVFNVADAVLFRPLAVHDPASLRDFTVSVTLGSTSSRKDVFGADAAQVEALREAADFADVIGFRTVDDVSVSIAQGEPTLVRAEFVSPEYFAVLGARSQPGRLLGASDRGSPPVPVVVSERWWRGAMNADPAAVERAITVNHTPAVVVGVVRDFRGLLAERPADLFLPLQSTGVVEPTASALMVRIALRLHPGVSTPVAEQRMAALYRGLGPSMARAGELRLTLGDASRGVSDARDALTRPLSLGMALVAVLLLVACANTGGLLVARFSARQTEFGIRVAIGAGRTRLVRQLIVEAMLLAALAGLAALLIARAASPVLAAAIPFSSGPIAFDVRFDWRLILFTTAVAASAAMIAAAVSLRHVLRADPASVLSSGTRAVAHGRRRALDALIAAQIGSSLLLLVATGIMARTVINLRHVDPGFDPSDAIAFTVDANAALPDRAQAPAYFARLYARLASLPDVRRLTLAHMGLLTRGMTTGTVSVAGRAAPAEDDRWIRLFFVGPDFFETTGMRIIAGQGLDALAMQGGQRKAVVTGQFAQFFFGSPQDAVGRVVNGDVQIVGVVADARYNTFRDAPVRGMFLPYTQAPPRPVMTVIARPAADQRQAIAAISQAIAGHDPRLKVRVTTLADQVNETMGLERFAAWIAAALTLLALCLACAGVYSTVAYAVSERRRELAVRLALGASPRDVFGTIVRDPLRVAALGIAVALPCTYAVMRGASALLFGVSAFDLPTVAASAAALLVVAATAAALPAWRATTIDPNECLRAL